MELPQRDHHTASFHSILRCWRSTGRVASHRRVLDHPLAVVEVDGTPELTVQKDDAATGEADS